MTTVRSRNQRINGLIRITRRLIEFRRHIIRGMITFGANGKRYPIQITRTLSRLQIKPRNNNTTFPNQPYLNRVRLNGLIITHRTLIGNARRIIALFLESQHSVFLPMIKRGPTNPYLVRPFSFLQPYRGSPARGRTIRLL